LVKIVSDESTTKSGKTAAMKALCVLYDAYNVDS
jgi:hypothetical protein